MKTAGYILLSAILIALTSPLVASTFIIRARAGLNISQHYGIEYGYEEYEVEKGIRWGTSSGLAFDFPITDLLTVSQEFLYTNKGSRQQIGIMDQPIELDVFYKTDYLEFPTLLILHYYRKENFALYYQTGFALSFMINAHYELQGIIETGTGEHNLDIDKKMKNIDQFDFGIILGGGMNFSLFERLLALDYRINFGIPFIDLPTTEDVFRNLENAPRVKLRNQSYSIFLSYFF